MTEETIFALALEQPDATTRAAFLADACGADTALRQRVEALLRTHEKVGDFLDKPVVEQLAAPPEGSDATQSLDGSTPGKRPAMPRTEGDGSSAESDTSLDFLQPSTRPDSLGRLGHYEALQILGRGGFGIVFRAFDETLQRVVALKVMAPQLAATSPARKRFLREARSSAQVRHENVVHVYEVAEQPLPYLAMEFIPGETLQQKLDRVGPLDVPETLRIGRQIAEGLAAAHATDLIHRDIKPGNVLLEGGQHKVKITDFGLARAADDASISQSGIIAGTPMYMAPEQALGQTLDQRADLFSLGSVLYQMVAGRPPFRANGMLAVLKRVAEDKPRAIREIIPETPQWLCDIIAKLHAKDPDDRYQSAREVADMLADCEAQLKANAKLKDYSRIPRSKPQRSGRRKWVAAAALVLLGLIGIAVSVWKLPGSKPSGDGTDPLADPAAENDLPLVANAPTDIIPFARPDLCLGRWQSKDGKLVHPARDSGDYPALALAVRAPDDFDLEAEFERTSGDDFIGFGMASRGHRFMLALDTFGKWAGLQNVDGELSNRNPTRRMGPWLTTGRRHTFRCEVRASGVRAWLDAREVVDYRGGYKDLGFSPPALPGWARFFIQADDPSGFVVHKLVLTPLNVSPSAGAGTDSVAKNKPAVPAIAPLKYGDPDYTNTLGMKFKLIPAGKFTMGSSQEEIDRCLKQLNGAWLWENLATEGSEHLVEITQPFYLGVTEVTVGQFRQFVDEEGYQVGDGRWRNPGFDQTDQHPVVWVSWNNAVDFCKWLSKKEGKEYRLPTEAQWEYSCRAGKAGTRYSFGDDDAELENYAWFNQNSRGGTHPVGKKKPNAWGLYDMHGNAGEHCQDNWDPDYYKSSPVKDPPGGAGGARAGRGGAWKFGPVICRSAFRGYSAPDQRWDFCGFRVLLVSPPVGIATESGAKNKPVATEIAPFTDADVQRIAALPAAQQVEEVRKELKRRNPGFDGKIETKIEGGIVTEFRIVTDKVTDIAPIRVFDGLRVLECGGSLTNNGPNGQLADLTPLKDMNLSALTYLVLWNTKVGDAGMAYFKDCNGLTGLGLNYTDVSDAGLVHFKNCKGLMRLGLEHTKVSDAGLANFKECKNLILLWLPDAQVGDAGMAHFQDCKALTDLNLAGTKVSDVGVAHFKDCKNLKHLYLDRTQVSDAGLAHFKGMRLMALNINDTAITDLTPLEGMPLEHVCLTPKNITRGLDLLRGMKSLKTIGIRWDQGWQAAEFWERYDRGEFK